MEKLSSEPLLSVFAHLIPAVVALAIGISFLFGASWLLLDRRPDLSTGAKLPRQLVMLLLTAIVIVIVVLTLPIDESTRNQLLGLLGAVLTVVVALSSTTFVSNAMAGIMLRSVDNFRPGDFVHVEDHFGRVSERGLFHTEIQTEDRDLTTLPNLYLVSNPVTVVHASGTIVSAELSLGYDVGHSRVEPLLLEAAKAAELADPFVQVLDLADHAVCYRISGFLEDVKHIISARSTLRKCVLDTLHVAGVEIVSPNFMNQRQLHDKYRVIPAEARPNDRIEPAVAPEDLAFDKAEAASRVEDLKSNAKALAAEIAGLEGQAAQANDTEKARLERLIAEHKDQLLALERNLGGKKSE